MKQIRILCSVLLAVLLTVGGWVFAVHADFGDFGGDSDYGDSGGFDWGGNDWDDDHYGSNGGFFSSSDPDDDDDGSGWAAIIWAVIIVAAIIFLSKRKASGAAGASRPVAPGATPTDPGTLRAMAEYPALDPQFSESAFREKLGNLYVQFQNAWQAKDMETLRPYLTDALYAKCDRQLDNYRRNNQTNRVENIAVLDVQLVGFRQEAGMDMVVARLRTRIVDYVVSDADGSIVRGGKQEKFMEYEWDLVRTSGTLTGSSSGTKSQNCPQCGAPIDINRTAKCEYCGCILTSDSFDWVVSEIKGISQRTGN